MLKAVLLTPCLEASSWTAWQSCDILWMLMEHSLALCVLLWGTVHLITASDVKAFQWELGFILVPSLLCSCFPDNLTAAEQNFKWNSVAF